MESTTCLVITEPDAIKSLAQHFATLTDKRQPRGLRYRLAPLMVLLLLAKLCGANNPQEMAKWIEHRGESLKEALGVSWKRMPHPSTFRRLLQSAIDLSELESKAGHYLSSLNEKQAQVFNLDGKTLRGTIAKGESRGLHLLALHQGAGNAVVAQTALTVTENEISSAKRLLKKANLQGKIVTGDAIFAQRELSREVVTRGGDYLWKVKENQEKLVKQIRSFFKDKAIRARQIEKARSLDKGHGRIEERVLVSSSRFADYVDWPFVAQLFVTRNESVDCQTGKRSRKTAYGITSLPPMDADAERLLELTRSHWGIENGLHHRRDVTFKEDACRMKSRSAAEALAVCNNLALGMLRHAGWENIAEARRFYSANIGEALRLIWRPPS